MEVRYIIVIGIYGMHQVLINGNIASLCKFERVFLKTSVLNVLSTAVQLIPGCHLQKGWNLAACETHKVVESFSKSNFEELQLSIEK